MKTSKSALIGKSSIKGRLKRLIKETIRFRRLTLSMGAGGFSQPLLGKIGEYYVHLELLKRGVRTIEKGGHSKYDLHLPKEPSRDECHVEVRTSLLKNEGVYPKDILFYGWRVETKGEKTPFPFDVLIGVALKKDFSDPQFYLFTKKELLQLQKVNMSRFKNVRRKIHLFPDTLTLKKAIAAKPEIVTWFERQINRKRNKYLNRWDVVVPRTLFSLNRL